jgi:hypothetical protein
MLHAIKTVDADINQDVRYAQEGRMPSMRCTAMPRPHLYGAR